MAAAGPPSSVTNTSSNNEGILIGDKVYSEVFLTIDNSLIPDERLSPTPSMQDGLDLQTETDLRILGCELLQSAGILLRLPQVAMGTGQVLFHRFFYSKSFVKHSFEIVAMACIYLASKIEEAPRRIRDVINVFHHLRQIRGKRSVSPLVLDQNYINTKNQVIKAERRILKELGFCVHVKHPHKIIVMYLQFLECEKNQTLVQTAWVVHDGKSHKEPLNSAPTNHNDLRNLPLLIGCLPLSRQPIRNYMNDSLRTNVFVRFPPETIACACIYLAARALQIALPTKPHWYLIFGATEEEIKDICITTLKLYSRKKPNYDHLEKEVEKRKVALQEAKLKAKGLNPDGTPALILGGGFSPGSKPGTPREVKQEEKSPNVAPLKPVKKEPEERAQSSKSPHNGLRKEGKLSHNSRSGSHSRSRTRSRSRSRSPRRHYNNRRSRSGTYSSRSRSRSHSRSPASPAPRRHQNHGLALSPLLPHLKAKQRSDAQDSKTSSRHAHKRKRSRSRSRSNSKPRDRDRDRDRDRERDRDRDRISSSSSDLKKHKHERSSGGGHHRDRRERSRSYERSHKSKHHHSSHSSHSRHRR